MDTSYFLNYTTRRKCFNCKNYIILEKEIGEYIYYKEKFYHVECLRNKLLNRRVGRLSEEDVERLIEIEKENTEKHSFNVIIKNHLYCYLMDHYEVIMLPNYLYTKMESIFTGSYKNMSCPVKPEYLLDMFLRRESFLDKIYHKQEMDGVAKINYNLQVLISKFPSYLNWIEKSKQEVKDTEQHIDNSNEIDFNYFTKNKKPEPIINNIFGE